MPASPFALRQAASGLKKVEAFEVRMLQDLNVGRGGLYASNAQARDGYWSIAVSANAGPQSACPRCRSYHELLCQVMLPVRAAIRGRHTSW